MQIFAVSLWWPSGAAAALSPQWPAGSPSASSGEPLASVLAVLRARVWPPATVAGEQQLQVDTALLEGAQFRANKWACVSRFSQCV